MSDIKAGKVLGEKRGDIDNPRVQCGKCGKWKRHYSVKSGICEYNSFPDKYGNPWCTSCIAKHPEEYESD